MSISQELLEILACPQCKGDLVLTEPKDALVCNACGSFYLVEENPSDARLLDTCPKCLAVKS